MRLISSSTLGSIDSARQCRPAASCQRSRRGAFVLRPSADHGQRRPDLKLGFGFRGGKTRSTAR
jgi:hypothetical protein